MKSNKSIDKEVQQEVKFTQLPFNIEETIKIENSPTYIKYKSWLKENGVLIDPRLRYPSYFGDAPFGVIGISASKPIQKQRAVIAVPYNLLITVDKVKSVPELNQIILNYFTVFGSKDDGAMKILVLYVICELIKGEKSFYHPYFSICSGNYLSTWSNWTAYKLQHRGVIRDLKSMQEQIERQFMRFLSILRSNNKIFPENISNGEYRNIFEKAYSMVTTRAFGWSLPSISMIPMADSLNHGNIRFFNHFVTNVDLEKHPQCLQFKFRSKVNLAILKDQYFTLNNDQLSQLRKQFRTKQSKFVQKHKQILIQKQKLQGKECDKITISKDNFDIRRKQYTILHQQYKAGVHKLKNLHFYESSCSQDNDTDEQTIFERESKMQTYELDDYTRNITEGSKKKQIKKLWKIYYQSIYSSDEEQQQQIPKPLPIINNKQMKMEIEQKMNKISDSSDISSQEVNEQDQQFLTFQKANHANSFFIMNTQEIIRQNQQVYNFYGRRSNKFLLLGYNFILKDNIYDSFPFRVRLDERVNTRVAPSKIIDSCPKKQEYIFSRQIRLKKFRINLDLIFICRAYIILWTKKEWKNGRICLPFDREIEQKTFEYYLQIINYLLKQYATSIDQDEQQEQVTKSYQEKLAIGLKIEYKKILLGQIMLVNKCLNYIKKWKINQVQDIEQNDMVWVKRLKPYLVRLEKASTL